ncbi:MAG: hypothetical protein QNJ98_01745 [Planctomycetota bacterium]|nr:hypothetical protein [Planctomycetota bacterium]
MGFFRKVETRTKICSRCKETLAWEATSCPACGAGRSVPPPEELSFYERRIRPHLPRVEWMVLSLTLTGLFVGGWVVMRHLKGKESEATQLRFERARVKQELETLQTRRETKLSDGLMWQRLAREKKADNKYTESEALQRRADAYLGEVEALDKQITAVTARLHDIDDRLAALDGDP